jgi:hypothetical protein
MDTLPHTAPAGESGQPRTWDAWDGVAGSVFAALVFAGHFLPVRYATLLGMLLQVVGIVMIALPIWRRSWGFDTPVGALIDERGRRLFWIRLGLALLLAGYVPLLVPLITPLILSLLP